MLVPVFMILLLGMLEFGIAFTHDQTLTYATREGARTGASLGNGSADYPCSTPNFDAPIVAAVERVLRIAGFAHRHYADQHDHGVPGQERRNSDRQRQRVVAGRGRRAHGGRPSP